MNKVTKTILAVFQGMLVGLGAVLPGVSGGVLCVIFGIYKPVMELLSEPFKNLRTHVPKLFPYIVGGAIGFLGVAKVLAFLLDAYPDPSVCLFIGLIVGMLPSLFKEAGEEGRDKWSFVSFAIALALILALLISLEKFSVSIVPNTAWWVFCGFCAALSIIAPGMSFSTLLMPLNLYTPFITGISSFDFSCIIPAVIGAGLTVILFAKFVDHMLKTHYSICFHAILGVVCAATIMTVPFKTVMNNWLVNLICFVLGVIGALLLDKFNSQFPKE
ncbi:MAG: DUF368 domain-containing protein [Erysipelotrichaceae bacterium]|nr:DUF368 domain-containing protein [Erysipelotrichaceae bacterium]